MFLLENQFSKLFTKFENENSKQLIWGSFFLLLTTVLFYLASNSLPFSFCQVILNCGATFMGSASLWSFILLFFKFPKPSEEQHLFHRTTSWEKIEKSGELYPTADASIFFVDSEVDLSNPSFSKKKTLKFLNAKRNTNFKQILAKPLSWWRFKMARGEWLAVRYKKIIIKSYSENDNIVIVENYEFVAIEGRQLYALKLRVLVNKMAFCVPVWFFGFSMLTFELQVYKKSHWYKYVSVWGFSLFIALHLLSYLLQFRYNKFIFASK